VKISRRLLRQFTRRALAVYPKEYGELLYGTSQGESFRVKEMVQVPYLNSTQHWWYDRSKIESERSQGKYLGTLHSHPDDATRDTTGIPSPEDWHLAFEGEEVIQGICHVRRPDAKPRTTYHFYLGHPACLDVEVA